MAYNRNQYSNYYRPSFFGGFSFFPPVIKALLLSNIGVFLGILFLGKFPHRRLFALSRLH